jgi:tetratricopeptide (TPR) repeat protein
VGRGFLSLQRSDLEAAQADLERALILDPDSGRAHLLLGQVFLRQGWLQKAQASFERATERDPDAALPATYLGRVHGIRGEHDQALACHERAVQADPGSATAWTQLGRSRAAVGDEAGARSALRTALRLDPGSLAARVNLLLLARVDGALSWAGRVRARGIARDFERLLATSGSDPLRVRYVRFLLGCDLALERALAEAESLVVGRETSYHCELLARVLHRLGRRDEAFAQLQRARTLDGARGGVEAARLTALLERARGGPL